MRDVISSALTSAIVPDRRQYERSTMVLRVGLLDSDGKSSFCLLRNISRQGVQLKLYSSVNQGMDVRLRVGDENTLEGRVSWVRHDLAGIRFTEPLNPDTLLRVRQMSASGRRRATPRAEASGSAVFRSGGQEYSAKLRDISTSGAKILTARSIEPGRTAVLLLPKMPILRAFVRWTRGQETGLIFETPIPVPLLANWLNEQSDVTLRPDRL